MCKTYSITSSARKRSEVGTSRPKALAVFRLKISSNLVELLDREISRLGALGNAIYVFGLALKQCDDIRSVG